MTDFGTYILELRTIRDRSRRWVERQSKLLFPDDPERQISHTYLKQLEEGTSTNPGLLKLLTLAAVLELNEKKIMSAAGYFAKAETDEETGMGEEQTAPSPTSHSPHLVLNCDSLPNQQGWTYVSFRIPEQQAFSIRGGVLRLDSIAAGFFDDVAAYMLFDAVDPTRPFVLTLRARKLQQSLYNCGFNLEIFTGIEAYSLSFINFNQLNVLDWVSPPTLDLTQFHDYRLEGYPGKGFRLFVDHELVAEGPSTKIVPPPITGHTIHANDGKTIRSFIRFGDAGETYGNAIAEIAALSFVQFDLPAEIPSPGISASFPPAKTIQQLTQIRHLILDLEGTLCLDDTLTDGVLPLFKFLAEQDIDFTLLTNNTARSPRDHAAHLADLGLKIPPERIYTATRAALEYLWENHPEISRLFVLGTPSMRREVEESGFEVVDGEEGEKPGAVLVGLDPDLNYERLCQTAYWIKRCGWYLTTHDDRLIPTNRQTLLLDCGSINASLKHAIRMERPPVMAGKPDPALLRHLMRRHRLKPGEVAVVGDDLETDVRMARQAGVLSILVLTGLSGTDDIEKSPEPPDLVVADLNELRELLERAKER